MFAPPEILHALAALDPQQQNSLRAYVEELEGRWRLAVSRELDARGKYTRLRESLQHAIQNNGLPPDARVKMLDWLEMFCENHY